MTKYFFLLATTAFALLFTACQPEIDGSITDVDTTVSYRVKTYTEAITSDVMGNSNTTYNLSYDANNRLTSLISATDPGNKFIYNYPSATKYTLDIYGNNQLTIHEDFYANSLLALDSTFQYNDTQDSSTEKYLYNASNQLVQVLEYDYSAAGAVPSDTTVHTYDANGNVTRTANTHKRVETYEYYPDLVYTIPAITGFFTNVPVKRQLVKKHTVIVDGDIENSADFIYTFDAKNRISTEKATYADGATVLHTYTYF